MKMVSNWNNYGDGLGFRGRGGNVGECWEEEKGYESIFLLVSCYVKLVI